MFAGSVRPIGPVLTDKPGTPLSNRVLTSLVGDEYQALHHALKVMPVSPRHTLYKQDDLVEHVFFPNRGCVCCVTKTDGDGRGVQIATIGSEGFVGGDVVWGGTHSLAEVAIHLPGDGMVAIPAAVFLRAMERRTPFSAAVTAYLDAFVRAVMQSVACNAMHSAEERCCRWLLQTSDCAQADEFPLTHDYLAGMLGLRRPTVTLVFAGLQERGVLRYRRGTVKIADRAGLERVVRVLPRDSRARRRHRLIFRGVGGPGVRIARIGRRQGEQFRVSDLDPLEAALAAQVEMDDAVRTPYPADQVGFPMRTPRTLRQRRRHAVIVSRAAVNGSQTPPLTSGRYWFTARRGRLSKAAQVERRIPDSWLPYC